ncbi:MAG: hypothetical protein KC468_14265 [Myxococcales bacterium]|nr:hypothetical protein [Myxococcales bacterium]
MSRRSSGGRRFIDWDRPAAAGRRYTAFAATAALLATLCVSTLAHAGRDELKAAYKQAISEFSNFEMEAAQKTLDDAIKAGKADDPDDPDLAPLLALKAGIVYNATGDEAQVVLILKDAVEADYNVVLPVEVRSEELQASLTKARESATAPSEEVRHTPPEVTCGEPIVLKAAFSKIPEGGQAALFWRVKGAPEFTSVSLDAFGNAGVATIGADEYDKDIEYFFYAYDGDEKPTVHKGDEDNPLELATNCKDDTPVVEKPPEPPPAPTHPLARFWINIGLGTGFGIASGSAEQSYQQFNVNNYGYGEVACAISRWKAAGGDPNAITQQDVIDWYGATDPTLQQTIVMSYNDDTCSQRHAVKTGFALAPFHIAPEFGFRVHPKVVISVFARIQAVTATSVFRDDPNKNLNQSFMEDVRSDAPPGVKTGPGFTIAAGAKARYFLLSDEKKFRLFVGGMLGGGFARLRVPMGFKDDRNGNSIPDNQELPSVIGPSGECLPVWPYNNACSADSALALADQTIAAGVVANASSASQRVDTVRLGPLMVGGLFGFNYQIVKNFALFAELNVGGWFWDSSSLLFDVQLGPVITF